MTEDRQKHWDSLLARSNRSPYYQLLGMSVAEIGEGRARLTIPVETKLHHGRGIVHGGVIASIADGAAAFTVYSLLEPGLVTNTVELKINYLRPVSKGTLTAEGRIVQKGKRIAVVDLEVWQDDGKLVAKGMATMMIG
ncbi:MAG: PaaI family thioesterase [Dehalococcoidia bacterium]|nr:PaaI family thioesterase [Dehalococcoidia bacterium]